jgi:UDP-N-acetylmuramoyl-tripeptide--D-alanyl-D-alanine ligase
MTVAEVASAVGAKILQGNPKRYVYGVSIDTRQLERSQLFFALRGERFDAHDFVLQAVQAGASGIVVERFIPGLPAEANVLQVADTLSALQKLARYNRDKFHAPVVAVTGSSGKTTTKDMIAAVLSVRLNTLKTTGNLNNEIGLPLTLLKLGDQHQAVVVEMAMRGAGEIDFLCRLARPTAAVITNIGEAHLERLGSIEEIAGVKGELLDHIPAGGFAVLNAHSTYMRRQAPRCQGKVLFFGTYEGVEIRASNICPDGGGNYFTVEAGGERSEMYVPLPGPHNVFNALSAIGVAREMGFSLPEIAKGLASVVLSGMRLDVVQAGNVTVINDTYNANPSSVRAALEVLLETACTRRKLAVLGDMLELGEAAFAFHHQLGEAFVSAGVYYLLTVGDLARHIAAGALASGLPAGRIFECNSNKHAVEVLRELLVAEDVVLVKGSRNMRMEEIVEALCNH